MSSDGRGFIFDQLDLSRSVALKSDLYRLDPASRRVTRLTRNARLVAPDVSPDASLLACIRIIDGARTLAIFRLATLEAAGPGHLPDRFSRYEKRTRSSIRRDGPPMGKGLPPCGGGLAELPSWSSSTWRHGV
jgi:hypothetical protein